ncbi:hypothetical protein [Ralstonia soli]|uniref:Uncharacterized protein n=1 Tax=Ralstonia soli TaxID=2953896 RepID=A0ABT1ANY9_9RALS|nr:hypothetical protein [Ralstonia soli]MCO5400138.1 hypothetical protein [Ralstonia soli]
MALMQKASAVMKKAARIERKNSDIAIFCLVIAHFDAATVLSKFDTDTTGIESDALGSARDAFGFDVGTQSAGVDAFCLNAGVWNANKAARRRLVVRSPSPGRTHHPCRFPCGPQSAA